MSLEFDFTVTKGNFKLEIADVFKRGVLGVFGPSGSGKTTLLHLIAGIEKPERGFLRWRGKPMVDTQTGRWTPPYLRGMAVVFQEARLFPHMSVAENLRYGEAHLPYDARRFRMSEVVDLLQLGPLLAHMSGVLSGGEAQRVALGRALMSSPHLLLLDEPLASLDRSLKRQILPYLIQIKEDMGIPMIYVSHDLGHMLQLADEILVLQKGQSLGKAPFLDLIQRKETANALDANEIVNVVTAEVKELSADGDLLVLQMKRGDHSAVAAPNWLAPPWRIEPKRRLQIGIRPEDIALASDPAPQVTIQNQIPGVVDCILEQGSRTRCLVDVGLPLLVEITKHAARVLDLKPGKPVYVFFKAQALKRLSLRSA